MEELLAAHRGDTQRLRDELDAAVEAQAKAEARADFERDSCQRLEDALRKATGGASLSPTHERRLTQVIERLQAEVLTLEVRCEERDGLLQGAREELRVQRQVTLTLTLTLTLTRTRTLTPFGPG